jgi:hypothetical protein
MNRRPLLAGAAVIALSVAAPAPAQSQAVAVDRREIASPPWFPRQPQPFGNLFGATVKPDREAATIFRKLDAPDTIAQPVTSVVCGLTLLPADPAVDARMRHGIPDGPKSSNRVIIPEICRRN